MAPPQSIGPSATVAQWVGFHIALFGLLAVELIYARRQARLGRLVRRTAIAATTLWTLAALGVALWIRQILGGSASVQYLAGYALEQSLSIDNLFVFLLLFRMFGIARPRQPKVLFWGVAGAMVMRGLFIAGGLALLARFHAVSYVFALILLVAAIRLLRPEAPDANAPNAHEPRWITWLKRTHPISPRQDTFVVREDGHMVITILLLALVAIELTDVVFALDSIPAVLSITRHPFLAYTSNIMAAMGLRSLYFLLVELLARLRFLHYGLALILIFAAIKMLTSVWVEIGALLSLGIIASVLAATIVLSILRPAQSASG